MAALLVQKSPEEVLGFPSEKNHLPRGWGGNGEDGERGQESDSHRWGSPDNDQRKAPIKVRKGSYVQRILDAADFEFGSRELLHSQGMLYSHLQGMLCETMIPWDSWK
jgi:hypothetical protein